MTGTPTVRWVTDSPQQMFDDAAAILSSALDGDSDAVAGTFDAVVDRAGLAGAYDVAWCLAATMIGDPVPPGACALDFPGIEQAGYDARWVARFVSAYANADLDTARALFGAAVADGLLPECLLTLAGSTVATLRHRAA
ncbi:hypothetical protein SAMN05443287_107347 [Micromonospora phaseoli]|uniref:Uncharacterized protein n=1 Tax=Micromonospora phaseoli TaxID=1144548 RepID=A0A1H7BL02_9ACTN|nr:hypothetical protein CLV64_10816 [Micromonospora phaseoli]GIJ79725.1 hypothetical protein Xph01_41570 [Micromonospora phaseoli]SEJ78301.1 hypothetical protein SAMN05443287_107347 [Micromonospora phaseoli]